ncbi:MAG TPA: HAD-IA family hydrolase, partial [Ktedonobacteraceae bacterium]
WQEIYREYNCDLPFEEWVACVGGTDQHFDPYANLEAALGQTLPREDIMAKRWRRHMMLIEELSLLPGVERYVNEARRLGLKIGLASNSSREWVQGHLQRLGLYDQFDVTKCGDEVSNQKPDPELYLAVLDELKLPAEQAVAFEDSSHGVLAARRAGIFCVAVPNAITRHLPLDHASLRLTSLADVPLEALLAQVEKQQKEAAQLSLHDN